MIVVTGGGGFIGSALIWKLNELGYEDILVVDNFGETEKWRNLVKRKITKFVHKTDFLGWLKENKESISAIFHMGACSATTERNMDYLFDNNVRYSMELFKFASEKDIPYIYASSAATYGNGELGYGDDPNTIPSLRPINQYGYSKQLFDCWVKKQKNVPSSYFGLKFFNVYGPQEYHKGDQMSLVAKAVPQIEETKKLKLFRSHKEGIGDGEQKRDFVYVKDVADVMMYLFENSKDVKSGIYNLGTGNARSFADLGRCTFNSLGFAKEKFEWIDMPMSIRNQYQYFTEASLENLRKAGYKKDFTSLEDGIRDYVKNYMIQEDRYF